jgi:hypothetical protein
VGLLVGARCSRPKSSVLCGWRTSAKQIVHKVSSTQVVGSWWVMTQEPT